MIVYAFDRDWTVDVNPHPRHEAVPLEWVRHLAHETPHPVYAVGNQDLAAEAAILGVVDIIGRHPDDWEQWLGDKQPDGRYERFPRRGERLALIADLHPDADRYIVVDDLDLSDIDGWEHYHAWEFVPAVKRGDIDPDLPWPKSPRTDGGYPTRAGIVPTHASDLSSFLDDHQNAPAFELRYQTDEGKVTRCLADVSMHRITIERPATAPAIECTPMAPSEEMFTVAVDDIRRLSVMDPPPETYVGDAETPRERAWALRRLADAKPGAVSVSEILTLLDQPDSDTQQDHDALRALRHVVRARPADCTPSVPILRSLLRSDDFTRVPEVLDILRDIGDVDANAIAPAVDEIMAYIDGANLSERQHAAECIAAIAAEDASDALDAVPALETLLTERTQGLPNAVFALSRIADEHPEAIRPHADRLSAIVVDEEASTNVRLNAAAALGRLVGEQPNVGIGLVETLVTLFDAENAKLRNNAIGIVGDVAQLHTDVVREYLDDIAPLLTVDNAYTRINASGTVSRVAEDFPDDVAHLTPTLIDLLDDDDWRVRVNACWALGYLQASEAVTALQDRAGIEDHEEVRKRATWALAQIKDRA